MGNAVFGDPAGGYHKQCYCSPTPPTLCAAEKSKDGPTTCKCSGKVYYGKRHVSGNSGPVTTFSQLVAMSHATKDASGSIKCSNSVFGDPAHGYHKQCYCSPTAPFICAAEKSKDGPTTCQCSGKVYYGKRHVSGKTSGPVTTFSQLVA